MAKTKHALIPIPIDLLETIRAGYTQSDAEKWMRENRRHGTYVFVRESFTLQGESVTTTKVSRLEDQHEEVGSDKDSGPSND